MNINIGTICVQDIWYNYKYLYNIYIIYDKTGSIGIDIEVLRHQTSNVSINISTDHWIIFNVIPEYRV